MKQVHGWWVPDYDTNMEVAINATEFADRKTYQLYAFAKSFPHIKNFRNAVDIGGHIGMWSYVMSRCFSTVTAFEPIATHAECFRRNLTGISNVSLCEIALGERADEVMMATKPPVSMKARIHSVEKGLPLFPVALWPLDAVPTPAPIDFMKIDCEGYEVMVLKGAKDTICRDKPTIVVEIKPLNTVRYGFGNTDSIDLLKSWGAVVLWEYGGDACMGWPA